MKPLTESEAILASYMWELKAAQARVKEMKLEITRMRAQIRRERRRAKAKSG